MRAGDAARKAGVSIKALRYYEETGLLRPRRGPNNYRDYSAEDVRVASEIGSLRQLGMAPLETKPFVDCIRSGHAVKDDCPESLVAYQATLDRLDSLIATLQRNREELERQKTAAARRGFRSFDASGQEGEWRPLPNPLPKNLPAPVDDGAAQHLVGCRMPALVLRSTDDEFVQLDTVSQLRWILFVYPLTGEPGVDMPKGWDEVPGARGCSQEACSFRDNLAPLRILGIEKVIALSTDRSEYQVDLVRRFHLPYPMLSDPELLLATTIALPTFDAMATTLYKRLTMILHGNRVEHVFYPVFPPHTHAEEVVAWVKDHQLPNG